MSREGFSLVDVAEIILRETKEPQNIYDLFDAVCTQKNIATKAKGDLISQFYADITTSAKFVYTGENTWDLKDNQKIELWEKDGSYYKEYTKVDIPAEYLEPKRTIRPGKVLKPAKKVVEEVKEVIAEVVVEPVVEVIPEPVIEEVVVEPAVEVVAEAGTKSDATPEEVEEDIFEDDFDEAKYNEYMDTYEDQYEKK